MKKNNKEIVLIFLVIIVLSFLTGCSNDLNLTEEYTLNVRQVEGGVIELYPNQPKYKEGTEVEIRAVSDENWKFVKWQGSLLDSEPDAELRISVMQNLIIEAVFEMYNDKEGAENDEGESDIDNKMEVKGHISLSNKINESNTGSRRPFSLSSSSGSVNIQSADYLEDEIIIKFKSSANREKILKQYQLNEKRSSAFGTQVLSSIGDRDINDLLNILNKNPNIEYAELNRKVHVFIELNEPENANKYEEQKEYYSLISLPYAWSITTGTDDITVAVLDTGIDNQHPDLRDNIINGKNFTGDGSIYDTSDINGHGTHVAGIIGAADNQGVVGVNWNVNLIPVKVLNNEGSGTLAGIVEGIEWVINETDTNIINMSLGTDFDSITLENAVEAAYNAGITVIAAAGNTGEELNYKVKYPAAYESVISVGSLDTNLKRSNFSSYGEMLDFMAPGEGIYSTLPGGGYGNMNGTSMAAPHIAGIAALILSRNANLKPNEVKYKLLRTAQDLGEAGKDYHYGFGLINSHAAVALTDSKSEIKVFAGVKDLEEKKIYVKSEMTTADLEGFYNLSSLNDEYYIYAWLNLSNNDYISSGDYFGKYRTKVSEGSDINFELNLITSEDNFEALRVVN
ncbi:S8 family serine peptidase [Natronospora cellulosivora (SeqCode)]